LLVLQQMNGAPIQDKDQEPKGFWFE